MPDTVVTPTLLQLRGRVRFYIDEPVQANFQDSDLNWAINRAQQKVATEISLVDEQYFVNTTPTVVTSVAGQRFYPLASDFWKMTRLEDVNTGIRLEFGQFADQDNSVSQIPVQFTDLVALQAAIDALMKDESDISPFQSQYNTLFAQLVRGTRNRQQQNPRSVTRVATTHTGWYL